MKPPSPQPQAFRPGHPAAPSMSPQAAPARLVQVAAKITHLDDPTLTVSISGHVVLSNELCRQLAVIMRRDGLGNLGGGAPIELEPPRLRGREGQRLWYLDVRPTAYGCLTHTANTRPQFFTYRQLPRRCFLKDQTGRARPLKLRLRLEVPQVPGYYPLEVI
jgi:hypothetical protein